MFESRWVRHGFVVCALLAAAACGRSRRVFVAGAAEPITRTVTVGVCASLTGAEALTGADFLGGFQRGIDEWNGGAGARRMRVELVTYDDQSRASACNAAVARLVTDDRATVVLCAHAPGGALHASASIVCAACPETWTSHVFGMAPSIEARAELLADLVVETMGMNKAAVLARAGIASDRTAGDAFRASLAKRKVRTVEVLTFTPETIGDVLAKLVADAPQVVLVALDGNEAALVGRAMRRRAVPSALLFFGTPNVAVLPEADRVAALEGALFPGLSATGSDARIADVALERQLLAHDAARRACTALDAAGSTDPQALRSALSRVPKGWTLRVARVQNGAFAALAH